jgi:Flp pilus assembly protein CpaB
MGTALETPQGATPAPESGFQTASLAVTPDQAKLLTLVDLNATLRLALRSPSDGSHHATIGEKLDLTQPISQAPRVAQAAPAPAAAPPAAPVAAAPAPAAHAAPRYTGPQIIQGDKVIR